MATVARPEPRTAARYGSAAQLAAYAGLSVKTIRRMVESGELRAFKVGARLLVAFEDLDRLFLRRAVAMSIVPPRSAAAAPARVPYLAPMSAEELAAHNRETAALLESFVTEGDEEEQRETLAVLRRALGPERSLSSRPLFP